MYAQTEHSETRTASTLPPARPDHETQAFETLIKKVGEGRARWSHLLELLESEAT
jgi:hypothetical protein